MTMIAPNAKRRTSLLGRRTSPDRDQYVFYVSCRLHEGMFATKPMGRYNCSACAFNCRVQSSSRIIRLSRAKWFRSVSLHLDANEKDASADLIINYE